MVSFWPRQSRPEHPRKTQVRTRRPRRASQDNGSLKRKEFTLRDLDDIRPDVVIGVKDSHQLDHLENFLRRRYAGNEDHVDDLDEDDEEDEEKIDRHASLCFYRDGQFLEGPEIPDEVSTLYYRAQLRGEDDQIRITWGGSLDLDSYIDELSRDVQAGLTISNLRRNVAAHLRIDDPFRILVLARGGLRPGVLQGESWQVNKLQTWLCRIIRIDVVPASTYVVLKGCNQTFLYHPRSAAEANIDARSFGKWFKDKVLRNVHAKGTTRLSIETDEVRLSSRGRQLTKRSTVRLGQTIDFELTHVVEERFLAEVSWLLPYTETCVVCSDDKRISEMPAAITALCEHPTTICRDCVQQWITSSMENTAWDRLKCPECPQLLQFEDVRRLASRLSFDRYDSLATKATLTGLDDFVWCLNARCASGQIERGRCPKVKCQACRASQCRYHQVPWHSKETCEQYDRRTRAQRSGDKASEKTVKKLTKQCPQCKRPVWKYQGCDHITCVCGHEWCYICFEKYYHDSRRLLRCKHKRDCEHFTNPPLFEGGRAFRAFLDPAEQERLFGNGRARAPPPPPWLNLMDDPFERRQPRPPPRAFPRRDEAPGMDFNPFQFQMPGAGDGDRLNVNHVRIGRPNDFIEAAAADIIQHLMTQGRR